MMSRRKVAVKAVLVLSAFLSAQCFAATDAVQSGKTYNIIMSTATSKDAQDRLSHKFIELVKEKSDGRIDGKVYTGGSLGTNVEVLRAIQSGSVQANMNPLGNLSSFVPQSEVFAMPWLYPGQTIKEKTENATLILRGKAGIKLRQLAEEKGFHIVSLMGISPQLIFTRSPVNNLEEMKGKKLRPILGKQHESTISDWGAVPVNMFLNQVFTASQEGVIDGFELPPDVTVRMKFYEAAPYVALTEHNMLIDYILVSSKWYRDLPGELRNAIDQAGVELEAIGTAEFVTSEMDALQHLKSMSGVTVVEFPKEDLAAMRRLNENGVWKATSADPAKGPMLKLLLDDIKQLGR